MIHPFAVFLSVEEVALVFILIGIDDLSLVGSLIVNPLSIVYSSTEVLQHSMSVLFIFDPISNILISILVVVCTLAMFLAIQPVTLVFLSVGVGVYAEAVLAVLVPFPVINSSTLVMVCASTVFLAVQELSLVLFTRSVDVVSVSSELIFLPRAHIDVLVGEGIDALATPAILVLPDVFATIRVGDLLILLSETARTVEKLRQELLSG